MFTTFTILKFLHISGAIVWIGGVATLTVIYVRMARTQDSAAVTALSQVSGFAGQVLVGPATMLTLLAGIATAATAGFDFGMLWLSWGFIAIILSIALGATFIRRITVEMGRLAANGAPDWSRMRTLQQRLTMLNLINLLILVSTVWAMVAKPTL
jgi:uncharacterized membrane protein